MAKRAIHVRRAGAGEHRCTGEYSKADRTCEGEYEFSGCEQAGSGPYTDRRK